MKIIARHQLIDQLNWRYATKQFDPQRKIPAADWATLEEAIALTPSSYGFQPWQFFVIDDPAVRAKLLLASYGQPQVTDASHLVVFTAKTGFNEADLDAHVQRAAEMRGTSVEALAGLKAMGMRAIVQGLNEAERKAWAFNQTYIAVGNLVTSAALLGIDACPMEGIERGRYDDLLGLKARGLTTAMIVTLGYRAPTDKYATAPKVRFPVSRVIEHV
jgi:nitroreductase